jgi:ADP-ribose pyrophosphatase YjhB (NUDIX family)
VTTLQRLRRRLEPVLRRLFHLYWRFARETFREALTRELVEEGQIELVGEPTLFGVYLNSHVSRRDHVAVYLVRQFRQDRTPEPNREIVECGFFKIQALPAETTKGTRLRISEVIENRPPSQTWR